MDTDNKPIQTFRQGAIGASIWRRLGANGEFFEFSLSRSFKRSGDDAGYTQSYRARNAADLLAVIGAASDWINREEDLRSVGQNGYVEPAEPAHVDSS
jgi:hypothetical protein